MPAITQHVQDMERTGSVMELYLTVPVRIEEKLNAEVKEKPHPVLVKALIDTGVTSSVVQEGIAEKMGLRPIGEVKINTPSTEGHHCYKYFLRAILPRHGLAYEGAFISAPLRGQNIQCVIGRDILSHGILIYIGYAGEFTLALV